MATDVLGFKSQLSSGSVIGHTNCDIDDADALQDTLSTYMKSDSFRTNAAKVLQAHSIDPRTVKTFHVDLHKDGSIYLILPSSGREFKLSNDPTVANAAFGKVSVHPAKTREDLVKPFASLPHPRDKASDLETRKEKSHSESSFRPVSTAPTQTGFSPPQTPVPPYSPGGYFQTPGMYPQQYPGYYPQAPLGMMPSYPQLPFQQQNIIGYVPGPQGQLLPVFSPGSSINMHQEQVMSPSMHKAAPVIEETVKTPEVIHTEVSLEGPLNPVEEAKTLPEAKAKAERALQRAHMRAQQLERSLDKSDLLRARDQEVVYEHLKELKKQHDQKTHKRERLLQDLESHQSTSNQIFTGLFGSPEIHKEEEEYLTQEIERLDIELQEIEAKYNSIMRIFALPESQRLAIIQQEKQALKDNIAHLKRAMDTQQAKYKAMRQTLQQTRLKAEEVKYETVTVEEFLTYYAPQNGRITYKMFQELLDKDIAEAKQIIQDMQDNIYDNEWSEPFSISELLFSSSKAKGEKLRSESKGFEQEVLKQQRIITMLERLKKTTRSDYIQKEQRSFLAAREKG